MNYKTSKPFLCLLCYSDKKISKAEAVADLKEWASSINVSGVVADKNLTIKGEEEVPIFLDGKKIFDLCYKLPAQSFLALGYSSESQGEYKGKGVSVFAPDNEKYLAVFISIGNKEGVLTYGK